MFEELKALGTSRLGTLGSIIIGPRGINKNYVINSYSHKADSYNIAQGSYLCIQRESIT
jgi:hypothetical protein